MDSKERIDQLTNQLKEAGYRYYVLDDPTMEDYEYDRLYRELEELEMTGGVLTAGGKIYGFAIASMINETMMDENIEKADGEEPGAYPMVCREMAKMMKQKYPGLVFINREEDTGDEGLRRSKESYCPVMLLEKYVTREAK